MSGHRNSHGKRHSDYTENGGGKRRNPGDDTYAPGPDDTVYRYLCASRKIGSIIGRGGEIAKQLRTETQAKIRIGDSVPGCEERVITIFSSSRKTNTIDDTEDKVCPAQDALFRVHERLATDESLGNEDGEEISPQVTVRLLVPSDQIGCILGKGGQIIQGIRSETGAQIRVLSNDHIPACAISGDELLQVGNSSHQFLHYLNKTVLRMNVCNSVSIFTFFYIILVISSFLNVYTIYLLLKLEKMSGILCFAVFANHLY